MAWHNLIDYECSNEYSIFLQRQWQQFDIQYSDTIEARSVPQIPAHPLRTAVAELGATCPQSGIG